jgi:hypothetical protein
MMRAPTGSVDYVEFEIRQALTTKKKIIPILVGASEMPTASQLPASIAPVAYLHAIDIRGDDFHRMRDQVDKLIGEIRATKRTFVQVLRIMTSNDT